MMGSSKSGIQATLYNPKRRIVHELALKHGENMQYDVEDSGEYKLCLTASKDMFDNLDPKQIKLRLTFSTEFYQQQKEKDGEPKKEEPTVNLENVATEGEFNALRKRIRKINRALDDIVAHQNWERQKESDYTSRQTKLNSNFVLLMTIQIVVVIASAVYSVINLRKYFVKKAIF